MKLYNGYYWERTLRCWIDQRFINHDCSPNALHVHKCAGDNLHWLTIALMTQIQPPKTRLLYVYHASGVPPNLKYLSGFIFDISWLTYCGHHSRTPKLKYLNALE